MSPRLLPLILLLAVPACAGRQTAQDQSPQAQCARQVEKDPRVRNIRMQQASEWYLQIGLRPELKRTVQTLTDQCLLTFGIGVPGGVAPIVTNKPDFNSPLTP